MTSGHAAYIAGLPRILSAAAALFRGAEGRVLIVEPNYRQNWGLPGGTIESDTGETPRQAAWRETAEEIGLDVEPGRLPAVDWVPGSAPPPLAACLYDGGVLIPEQLAAIRLQEEELLSWRLVPAGELDAYVRSDLAGRIRSGLEALADGTSGAVELVNGRRPVRGHPTGSESPPTLGTMTNGKKPLVALLTGAGISTDSGIPDYRGPQGLWRRDPDAEKLITYAYYMADPDIRRRAWLMRRDSETWRAEPNAAHHAVAALERSGVPVRVITQNVDGLHQLAGLPARKVLELHGSARSVVCTGCGAHSSMEEALARVGAGEADPPCLVCGGILKSATVMFGQPLDQRVLGGSIGIAKACEVFIAVGTSLQVQPAASLAGIASDGGARLVIVNAEPTTYDELADEIVREPIGTALPALLKRYEQDGER